MSMNDPGQYQNIDPQMLQMFIANAIGPKKQGVTQSDINPIQDIIMSQMLGMPVNKPVNENLIRSINAPQWSAMANYTYKDTDIEPKIMQLIGQGIPLTEVKKKIKEELALQGLPTDSKNEQVKNLLKLSDTLYSEFTNSNSKILEAKQASLTNSPYTKFGVSDPNDYNRIDDATLAQLGGPNAAGSVGQTLGLNQIVDKSKELAKELAPGEKRQGLFNQDQTKLQKFLGKPSIGIPLFPIALPLDSIIRFANRNKIVGADGKLVKNKSEKWQPKTQAERQWVEMLRSAQNEKLPVQYQKSSLENPVYQNPGKIPIPGLDKTSKQTKSKIPNVNELSSADIVDLNTNSTLALNKMNAAKSATIAQMVAENRRQQIDANSANTASNKSNQDIIKKLVLMKVMGNPKLLANPAIQQVLGS